MYICVINNQELILLHKNVPSNPQQLLNTISLYGKDIVTGAGIRRKIEVYAEHENIPDSGFIKPIDAAVSIGIVELSREEGLTAEGERIYTF
jgi:hypothetical protein